MGAITSIKVMDFRRLQMTRFADVRTLWGERLADFHHGLLSQSVSEIGRYDISPWYESHGEKAKEYYPYYLALFICHGILFENFITNGEDRFTKSVVFPAFKQVVDHFGIKPLIVPLVPHETASDIYWRCYPAELEEEVLRCLSKVKDSSGHQHAAQCKGKNGGTKRDKN